jgi:hypothetical protein
MEAHEVRMRLLVVSNRLASAAATLFGVSGAMSVTVYGSESG